MSALQQNMNDLAKEHGLVAMDTEKIIEMAKQDILITSYRKNPVNDFEKSMNARVEKVYKDWYGSDFKTDPGRTRGLYLYGPPGQGKTTSLKVAAQEVAAALGLRYLENPTDSELTTLRFSEFKLRSVMNGEFDDPVSFEDDEGKKEAEKKLRTGYKKYLSECDKAYKETFLFVSIEMSGENSAVTFAGIPFRVEEITPEGKNVTYMKKVPNKRLALLEQVAGSYLLLDDFANASQNVQNAALPIMDEGRLNGLNIKNTCVGLTGNLGASDGTNTAATSSALTNRVKTFFVYDTPENFIQRAFVRYNDDIGDVGIIGFMERYKNHFYQIPTGKSKGGFPSSRSWDNFILHARATIRVNGGRGKGELKSLGTLKQLAGSMLGLAVQQDLASYYDSLMRNADPIARAVILEGAFKDKKEEIHNLYGKGHSEPQRSWGYSFSVACADYLVRAIADAKPGKERDEKFDISLKRFGEAMVQINEPEFAFSCDYFKSKLSHAVPEYSVSQKLELNKNHRSLKGETMERMVKILSKSEGFDARHLDVLIRVLSGSNKIDGIKRTRRAER